MLSTVIWLPIFAGIAVLLTGSDRNAHLARMLALIGALAGFVAQAKPGRSPMTSQHQTGRVASGSQPDASASPDGSSAGATPLAPPPAPPAPAPSSSGIVSGGS